MSAPRLIVVVNLTALVAMMFSMGLRVRLVDLLVSVRPARRLVLGLLANYLLVPAVTVGLLVIFRADAMVSAGFLILAVCPGAPLGPPIAGAARGDVPWSVGMMLILAGLSAFLSPLLLGVLLARIVPDGRLHIDTLAIVRTLLVTQFVPLVLGLGLHHRAPGTARRIARPIGALANVLLVVLVGLIVAKQHEMLAAIRPRAWVGMGVLLGISLAIGWACGGPDIGTRKAMAATTAVRNAAVGLVIAGSSFAGTPAVTAVVAYSLVSILGTLGLALLSGKFAPTGPLKAHAGP